MPLSGEAIRLMNYIDDVSVTLRRILTGVATLDDDERSIVFSPSGTGLAERSGCSRCACCQVDSQHWRGPAMPDDLDAPTEQLAVIGAGPLGRQLAFQAARAGFRVILEDVMPSSLRHAEEALRERLNPAAMPLVNFALTVEEAVREADLAIDCVPDELESKLEIFSLLDRMAPPRTVFATPTLNLSIADLASCTYRPEQCVGLAIYARQLSGSSSEAAGRGESEIPVRITSQTSARTQAVICGFWRRLGYSPVIALDAAEAMLR